MKVPVQEGPTVRPAAVTPTYGNVNYHYKVADGSAVAQGLEQLSSGLGHAENVLSGIAATEFAKQTNGAVDAGTGEFQSHINSALNGDAQAGIKGYLEQNGNDAIGTLSPTMEDIEKKRQELLGKQPNSVAKEKFDLLSRKQVETAKLQANKHFDTQQDVAAKSDLDVATTAGLNALPGAYANEKARTELMALPRAQIQSYAKLHGVDPGPALAEFDQKAHGIVLEQYLLNNSPLQAQEYLAANKAALGTEAPKYESRIKLQAGQQQALTEASRIAQESRPEGSQWVDPVKAFQAVDAMPDGPLKEDIRKEVRERVSQSNTLQDLEAKKQLNNLVSLQERGISTKSPEGIAARAYLADPANGGAQHLQAFDDHQEAKAHAREVEQRVRQNAADAEARRRYSALQSAQNDGDKKALNEFLAKDPKEIRSMSDDDIRAAYMGKATDDGINIMIRHARGFEQRAKGGGSQTSRDHDFSALLNRDAFKAGLGGPSNEQTQKYRAEMTGWRMEERERNQGKEPTSDEVLKKSAELLTLYKVSEKKSRLGMDWLAKDRNEESFGFELDPVADQPYAKPAPSEEQPLPRIRAGKSATGSGTGSEPAKSSGGLTAPTAKPAIDTSTPVKEPGGLTVPNAGPKQPWKLTGEDYLGISKELKRRGIEPTDAAMKRAMESLANAKRRNGG